MHEDRYRDIPWDAIQSSLPFKASLGQYKLALVDTFEIEVLFKSERWSCVWSYVFENTRN